MAVLELIVHAITPALRGLVLGGDAEPDPAGLREIVAEGNGKQALTSPARAAVATAEALGYTPRVDPELRDREHGEWTGRGWADLVAAQPEAVRRWVDDPYDAPPGGESVSDLVERVRRWLARSPGGVAVTHPAVVRAALLVVGKAGPAAYRTYDVRPLDRVRLVATEGGWRDLV